MTFGSGPASAGSPVIATSTTAPSRATNSFLIMMPSVASGRLCRRTGHSTLTGMVPIGPLVPHVGYGKLSIVTICYRQERVRLTGGGASQRLLASAASGW